MCPSSDSITWFWPPPPRRVQLPVGPWSSELFWLTVSCSLQQFHFQIQCVFKKESAYFFLVVQPGRVDHLLNVELRHNVDGVPKTSFYSTLTGKTTSWISLILFPALLYSHLFNVELRHNVAGVPKTSLYSTLTGKTTSWISLILFPALLYSHLFNVELRHNVAGVPKTTLYSTLTGKTWMLSLGTMSMACLKPLCTLPWRGKPRLGSL